MSVNNISSGNNESSEYPRYLDLSKFLLSLNKNSRTEILELEEFSSWWNENISEELWNKIPKINVSDIEKFKLIILNEMKLSWIRFWKNPRRNTGWNTTSFKSRVSNLLRL